MFVIKIFFLQAIYTNHAELIYVQSAEAEVDSYNLFTYILIQINLYHTPDFTLTISY